MDALQCIRSRRSGRSYEDRPIPKDTINELLRLGTKAATGSGMQPWGFVVLEGRERIEALSTEIKAWLRPRLAELPWLAQYEEWLGRDSYNIFYNAHNVIAITGILPRTGMCTTQPFAQPTSCWQPTPRALAPAG